MIAIHITVHISSAVGPTQGRRQLQRRWKKVHLASVVTDVSVYLHGFLHRPANGRDYILTCFSLQLAQNPGKCTHIPRTWVTMKALAQAYPPPPLSNIVFSQFLYTCQSLFVFFSLQISLIGDIDPALIEMEPCERI